MNVRVPGWASRTGTGSSWLGAKGSLALHSLSPNRAWLRSVRDVGAALALGSALGFILLVARPRVALGAVAGLFLVLLTFSYPEFVILIVLCFATGLIPGSLDPFVALPVGHFRASELAYLWLLFFVLFRILTDRSFRYVKTSLDRPALLFCVAVLIGLGTAVLGNGISFSNAVYEARTLIYYLILFPITNLVRTRSQIVRLVQGVLTIGLLLAIQMLARSTFGSASATMAVSVQNAELVRVMSDGAPCVYVAFIVMVCYLALGEQARHSLLRWFQVVVMAVASLTGLARNLMIQLAAVGTALVLVLPRPAMGRLGRNLLGAAFIAIVLVLAIILAGRGSVLLGYATAYLERFDSMFSSRITTSEETLAPRVVEMRFAWEQISTHPILGIGLYNPYRPRLWAAEPKGRTMFLHNAYLSMWLKTGLLGLISFLWLSVVFLSRGLKRWRTVEDIFLRAVVLGVTLAYITVAISNLVAPSFLQSGSLPIFGVSMGLSESILLHAEPAQGSR